MAGRDLQAALAGAVRALYAATELSDPEAPDGAALAADPAMRLLAALEACRSARAHVDLAAALLADRAISRGASLDALGFTDDLYG